MIMNFKKEHNQYYATFIESRIVAYINQEKYIKPDLIKDFLFSAEEIAEMEADALTIAKAINGKEAVWVGRNTANEDCDIIVDGRKIEIKYVGSGSGTYLNTSLSYFSDRLDFIPFTEYTHKTICPYLEQYFGEKVYNNFSPVSMAESKEFRHERPTEYEALQKIDKTMRKQYVKDLYNYLISNPILLNTFVSDIISKNVGNKKAPESLIVFNHETKEIKVFSEKEIKDKIQNKTIKNAGLSLAFDGFRVAIGWQNGNGLNNPTLRVFLK
jgi:hypothetical protein